MFLRHKGEFSVFGLRILKILQHLIIFISIGISTKDILLVLFKDFKYN